MQSDAHMHGPTARCDLRGRGGDADEVQRAGLAEEVQPRKGQLMMTPADREWLAYMRRESRSPCDCCDCDGEWCTHCLTHHGRKPCPAVQAVREEIAGRPKVHDKPKANS